MSLKGNLENDNLCLAVDRSTDQPTCRPVVLVSGFVGVSILVQTVGE